MCAVISVKQVSPQERCIVISSVPVKYHRAPTGPGTLLTEWSVCFILFPFTHTLRIGKNLVTTYFGVKVFLLL